MQNHIISSKPLFEFTDLELKALAFEHYEMIKNYETSLNLIKSELTRRTYNSVVTVVNNDVLTK